jgi:hypothetical protein
LLRAGRGDEKQRGECESGDAEGFETGRLQDVIPFAWIIGRTC